MFSIERQIKGRGGGLERERGTTIQRDRIDGGGEVVGTIGCGTIVPFRLTTPIDLTRNYRSLTTREIRVCYLFIVHAAYSTRLGQTIGEQTFGRRHNGRPNISPVNASRVSTGTRNSHSSLS